MDDISFPFQPKLGATIPGSRAVIKANWRDAFEPERVEQFKADLKACDLKFAWFTADDCPYVVDQGAAGNGSIFAMAGFTCIVMATAEVVRRARDYFGQVADAEATLKTNLGKLWKLRFERLVRGVT